MEWPKSGQTKHTQHFSRRIYPQQTHKQPEAPPRVMNSSLELGEDQGQTVGWVVAESWLPLRIVFCSKAVVAGQQCQEHLHLRHGQSCTQAIPAHSTTHEAASAKPSLCQCSWHSMRLICNHASSNTAHGSHWLHGIIHTKHRAGLACLSS